MPNLKFEDTRDLRISFDVENMPGLYLGTVTFDKNGEFRSSGGPSFSPAGFSITPANLLEVARHFYELGRESMKKGEGSP